MTKSAKDMSKEEILEYLTQTHAAPLNNGSPLNNAANDFLFTHVWNSSLSWREKRLISLTVTAIAGYPMPLETHVRAALKSGDFTLGELQTFAVHVAAYAGFPVGAGVETTIQKVVAEGL